MKTVTTKPIFEIFSKKTENKSELPKLHIIVDYREKNSLVVAKLKKEGFDISFEELKVGDYIIGQTIIERKTIKDFISSMINKRILRQIEDLKTIDKKLLVVEGFEDSHLYPSLKNDEIGVNPNAIRGFLLSIALKHKIPMIFTKNEEDSARFMKVLYNKKEKEMSLKHKKRVFDKSEQLQVIMEAFPAIGPKTSKKLLHQFGTIQNIINAPEENLRKILGKKTGLFLDTISRNY